MSRDNVRLRGVILLLVLAAFVVAGAGAEAQKKQRRRVPPAGQEQDHRAPAPLHYGANDFSLKTLEGSTVTLSSYAGRVVLVTIFSPSCGPCTSEADGLAKVYAEFHRRGFDILGVGVTTSETEMRTFVRDHGLRWTFGINDLVPKQFGMVGLPDHYLFDRDGTVLEHYVGYLRADILRDRLRPLLTPRAPSR